MSESARVMSSDYMEWAKTRSGARYSLASSGNIAVRLAELPVKLEDLEITGWSPYGYEPLQRALATKFDVDPASVVAAAGTSMANHLAMAALIEPGDEVVVEQPAYEPILAAARYLRADLKRFSRRFENGFQIDPDEIKRAVSPRTRLIVLTNLHNPSSVLTSNDVLARIGEIARAVNARVLVDEVYLEAVFEDRPRSAMHLGEEFVVTGSLTKAYGLSGLRCGWVLAAPDLARKMWRLNDLFGVVAAHAAELLSVIALANLDTIAARARALLDANRVWLTRFLEARDDLESVATPAGTTVFPRLIGSDVEELCALLREKYETSVVPGRFFEMPQHIRIGIGQPTDMVTAGLERLAAALDELKR